MTTAMVLLVLFLFAFIGSLVILSRYFDVKAGNKELRKRVIELHRELDAYKLELAKHNDISLLRNGELKNKAVV